MSKIQVDDIVNKDDNGAPSFPYGATFTDNIVGTAASFTGIVTATSLSVTDITATGNVSIAGTLTYEDVTNVDSIGIITARSDISIADKIVHTGDTNTAIRFPAADTFTVETAGSEALRVDSSGRVGIGTVNPGALLDLGTSTPILRLSDSNTTGYHQIQSSNSNFIINADPSNETANSVISFKVDNSEAVRIDSSGNIGIGTDNPTTKLDVAGNATFTGYVSANTATGDWVATQLEAETGTNNTQIMTPLRVAQAIAALGGSVINSIQRGTIAFAAGSANLVSQTATISSVTMNKTMLSHLGTDLSGVADTRGAFVRISLTSSTEVTANRLDVGAVNVNYEVIEFT